ncbi:sulfatase-like hydrolase/transferase [Paraglaciecola aquimarina]|uniref:Sulfatase-like hydrolase/transferase n=1 Tax=Paraglaciecola aquimarina TaxID=1235557 RepID=A0ABU3SYN8_9ALTE|nr:sulfatase-like hydrolase/transferase [Paraglaciecola aquimarina]MDU0355135.1 sulfatase-like hydrolase/transferase [Paraglaciecola aquimarina]
MKRKLTLLSVILTCSFSHNILAKSEAHQPNILWIVTDDQRADSIAAFNQATTGKAESALGYVASPHIDALAKDGVMFTHAYNNSPACAPSRDSMLMGLYPHHSGRYGFEQTHNEHDLATKPIPQVLKENGYQTVNIGKSGYRVYEWQNKPTWNSLNFYDLEVNYKNDLNKNGLTDFYKETKKAKGITNIRELYYFPDKRVHETWLVKNNETIAPDPTLDKELHILRAYSRKNTEMILGGQSPKPAGETLDGHIVKTFQQYLANPNSRYKTNFKRTIQGPDNTKPLMVNLGFHLPHTPVLPPKSFRDQFKNKHYQVPDFSLEERNKLPPQLQKLSEVMDMSGLSDKDKQQAIADYYAFCAYGDALIGEAIESFKQYSKQNNQEYVIVLTVGDHGWQLGEQGIEAKFSPWNTSNQGVMIVAESSPKAFLRNTVHSGFVEYVDIAPTIYGAAKIEKSKIDTPLDGYDLAEVLADKGKSRDYVLGEINHVVGPRAFIRSDNFAFSMRTRPKNGKPGQGFAPGEDIKWAYTASPDKVEMALYDLRCDPNEQNNIAYDKSYHKITAYFRKKLADIMLGDGRVEIDWKKTNSYKVTNFAKGADDKKIDGLPSMPRCSV